MKRARRTADGGAGRGRTAPADLGPGAPRDIELSELFEFCREEGQIRLHELRVVILSAAAMGVLRKELIDALGVETARRWLMRFGYVDGYHDAVSLREQFAWADPLDAVRALPALNTLEGLVHAELSQVAYHRDRRTFDGRLRWRRSYEAEQHLHHFGPGTAPVCWSLAGYASGYASACLDQDIYFREIECVGTGAPHCSLVGKDAAAWGSEAAGFVAEFQGANLAAEIQRLRVAARRQRQDPTEDERLLVERSREIEALRERTSRHARSKRFVVASAAMRLVLELAARVAPLDTTVLVCGESGTGKEFVVRMIHEQSPRASGPLVSVNCAALTETLLESELFGHVRGAFTGAVRDKAGLFELAGDGTLFLDEVGEMTPALQAKLLRALEAKEIRRVGGERSIHVSPRIVAASNRDLREAVASGAFREDLFFRIAAFIITVPPLRERREAIPALAHEFLRRAAKRFKKDVRAISPEAMTVLVNHSWPGNVRELEHAIERAVILAVGTRVTPSGLPPELRAGRQIIGPRASLDLRRNERALIEEALRRFRGNRRRAAEALGISTVTLWRRIRFYGLDITEADESA